MCVYIFMHVHMCICVDIRVVCVEVEHGGRLHDDQGSKMIRSRHQGRAG